MMMRLALGALAIIGTQAANSERMDEDEYRESRLVGEQLDFVEKNVLNLLRLGYFPQLYDASYTMMQECGCYYAPNKIIFGTRIGLQCHRLWMDDKGPQYNAEKCGEICNDPHGVDIVLFCPHGWEQDCSRGCFPPDEFGTVEKRIDFWELTLSSLLMHGSDYIAVEASYLKACGCDGKIRPIRYGTQVGFDCILGEDAEPSESCGAARNCQDSSGKRLMTFCPAGHRATCSGCEKIVEDESLQSRLDWMINVITGYARESLELLGWKPTTKQMLACACSDGVEPVQYGKRLGYSCPVYDTDSITKECGPNTLCRNPDGDSILHFCPDGFTPSCSEGCSFPWSRPKDEL